MKLIYNNTVYDDLSDIPFGQIRVNRLRESPTNRKAETYNITILNDSNITLTDGKISTNFPEGTYKISKFDKLIVPRMKGDLQIELYGSKLIDAKNQNLMPEKVHFELYYDQLLVI